MQVHTFLSSPSRRVGRVQKFQRARRHREATREISEDKSQKARSPRRGDARKLQRTRVGSAAPRRGDARNNQSPKKNLFSFKPDIRRATEAYHLGARRTGRSSRLPSRRGIATRGAESIQKFGGRRAAEAYRLEARRTIRSSRRPNRESGIRVEAPSIRRGRRRPTDSRRSGEQGAPRRRADELCPHEWGMGRLSPHDRVTGKSRAHPSTRVWRRLLGRCYCVKLGNTHYIRIPSP